MAQRGKERKRREANRLDKEDRAIEIGTKTGTSGEEEEDLAKRMTEGE